MSTKKLMSLYTSPDVKVIDVRPIDAYNGWQLQHEVRGGYIFGARSLLSKWLKYIDWLEIVRLKIFSLRKN